MKQREQVTVSDRIDEELREYAESLGAELYGVASAEDYAREFPDKPQPTRFVEDARSIVVIGLPFEPGTVATALRLTPEFGPRVFVTSLITDCLLEAGRPMEEEMCDHCNLCVDNCPAGALDGLGWKNPFAYAVHGCCGTCIAICPVGEM